MNRKGETTCAQTYNAEKPTGAQANELSKTPGGQVTKGTGA